MSGLHFSFRRRFLPDIVNDILETIQSLDEAVLKKINLDWANPVFDFILVYMADFGLLKWPLLAGVIFIAIRGSFRARVFVILMGLALLIGDAGINSTLKDVIGRPRPHETVPDTRRVKWEDGQKKIHFSEGRLPERGTSMTSGHVCNNVALATLLTLLFGRKAWLAWVWAAMMAYSRIYTGDHYLTDAVVSFFVAVGYSLGIYCFLSWLWQLGGPKLMPKVHERHPQLNSP